MRLKLSVAIILVPVFSIAAWYLFTKSENTVRRESEGPVTVEEPVFEKRKIVRDVTPREFVQAPKLNDEMLERLPAVEPPVIKEKAKPNLWKKPRVLQAGVLRSGTTTLRLKNIRALPLERNCLTENGEKWPCGRFARTAFRNLIRGRTLTCDENSKKGGDVVTTICKIGSVELSEWLVVTGWAEPMNGHYQEALKQAKAAQRGIWQTSGP